MTVAQTQGKIAGPLFESVAALLDETYTFPTADSRSIISGGNFESDAVGKR